MSTQRKLNGYLERKESLIKQYKVLKPEFTKQQQNLFYILIKLDEQVYEYNVVKSYLDMQQKSHKPDLPQSLIDASRTKLKLIYQKIRQIEDEIYFEELAKAEPKLTIIRKEIADNAAEAGNIIHSYEVVHPKEAWHLLDDRMYDLRTTLNGNLKLVKKEKKGKVTK